MDDFSTPGQNNEYGVPPSPANYIRPGKRPMSSMCPSIIVDQTTGQPIMVVGAAGGTKITTTVASVILSHLYKHTSISDAIAAPRVHHQLAPIWVEYDADVDQSIVSGLQKMRHQVKKLTVQSDCASCTGVSAKDGKVEASFDPRRGGSVGYV